jgi:hypothetical protein
MLTAKTNPTAPSGRATVRDQLMAWAFRGLPLALLALIVVGGPGNPIRVQAAEDNTINYAYATWIGTGYYRVKNQRVWVFRAPLSYTLRETNREDWGLDLLLPVTFGVNEFMDDDETVASATFVPGLMVSYPVLDNWWLKPFAQFGVGNDFSSGELAYIYAAGIKSLVRFELDGFDIELGNALVMAENTSSERGRDNGFSMGEIGLNVRLPLDFKVQNKPTNLNIFTVYTEFLNSLDFFQAPNDEIDINRLYKFGLALGVDGNLDILGFAFRGVGVDLTLGDGFTGFGLTTGFPF